MLTIGAACAALLYLLYRQRDRSKLYALLWRLIERGATLQERLFSKRWIIATMASVGVAGVLVGSLRVPFWQFITLGGLLLLLFVVLAVSDWSLGWTERQLGSLVRSREARRSSFFVLSTSALFLLAVLLFWPSQPWMRLADPITLVVLFFFGIRNAFMGVRHSLRDTFPEKDERQAAFVIPILQVIAHHLLIAIILSWGFLGYFNKLLPKTFVHEQGSAGFWVLGNYVVGKLTVSGSNVVTPQNGFGILLDTVFGLIGFGFVGLAVTSFFSILSRAKPDKMPK